MEPRFVSRPEMINSFLCGMIQEKFYNKFKLDSIRLKNFDYSSPGLYFVTICTKNRSHFFGSIKNEVMILNNIGEIAEFCWQKIPNHFPFVKLWDFVIMPNHIHGLIEILHAVETQNLASLQTQPASLIRQFVSVNASTQMQWEPNKFGPQSKNLPSIIRGFKIGVTKNAKLINPLFKWQSLYYESVVRKSDNIFLIQNYIQNNPKNWQNDKENQ